jgi:hypothetical protein
MSQPRAMGPSDVTRNRLEGLIQNEYKEHGAEGVEYLGKAVNDSFVKAQKEGGAKGDPLKFSLSKPEEGVTDARITYPDRPQLHHSDFSFYVQPKGER